MSNKLFQKAKWGEAIEQYQKILEIQKGDATVYWCLSECFRNLKRLEQMFSILREGVKRYPTDACLHFSLIVNLQRNGRIQQAIASANTASKLIPNDYTFKILGSLRLVMAN